MQSDMKLPFRVSNVTVRWIGVFIVVAVLVAMAFSEPATKKKECSEYADVPMRDVPARCISFWEK